MPPFKTAVVTGGASGIGRAMARHLVSHGDYAHVAILDVVDRAAGAAVAADLAAADSSSNTCAVHYVPCDVTSWAAQAAAFAEVFSQCGGRIDVVMANAGISEQGASSLVEDDNDEDDEGPPQEPTLRTLDVNLTGAIYTVKLAVHYIKKNQARPSRGSILCTASNAGLYAFPAAPLYAASKAVVIGLVRSLEAPLARSNIQINALAPAVLETNIADKALFKDMIMTPMATLVRGVEQLLADPSVSGAVAEIHGASVTLRPPYAYVDADTEKNLATFWSLGYA